MSTYFRSQSESPVDGPEPTQNEVGAEVNVEDLEPLEDRESRSGDVVLDSLGISDDVSNMPSEDQENAREVKTYVRDIIRSKGLQETTGVFKKVFGQIQKDMGLDRDSDPSVVLDRIGGVVKAWKSLAFITDMDEKKRILRKLSQVKSSKDMNRIIFKEMEHYEVWR